MRKTDEPRFRRGIPIPTGQPLAILQLSQDACLVKTNQEPPYLLYQEGVSTGELYAFAEVASLKARFLH